MKALNLNYFKTLSLSELGLLLLIPLASLTSHTWLPIPPTMVLFFGAVVCWIFLRFSDEQSKIKNQKSKIAIVVFTIFAFYIFASQYFMGAEFRHYMGAVFAPLYLVLILIFSQRADNDFLKNLGQKFIRYTLIIFCVEVVLRYAVGFFLYYGTSWSIYSFKFHGPIYLTSNAVAAHLVTLLFFMFWWGHTYKQSMKKEICIALILIVLTLSRASILAVAVGLFYYVFFKNADWKKSLLVLFLIGIFGILALWAMRYFPDYSFQSKFLILEEALKFYRETASLNNILFGVGFGETQHLMTHYAHNYFLVYLMESGVFGLLLLLTTLFVLVKITNGKAAIILVPFLVQTAAESQTFLPYFYVIMAFIIINNPLLKIRT